MSLQTLQFNEHGYLIPGLHDIVLEKFKELFVDSFPNSKTREKIFNGYRQFCLDFHELEKYTLCHWLNGSFSTSKENPNDIDMFVVLDGEKLNNASEEEQKRIWSLVLKMSDADIQAGLKEYYFCDIYICDGSNSNQKMKCIGWFTFDREEKPKGLLKRIDLKGGDCNG